MTASLSREEMSERLRDYARDLLEHVTVGSENGVTVSTVEVSVPFGKRVTAAVPAR